MRKSHGEAMEPDYYRIMLAAAACGHRAFPTELLFKAFRTPRGILEASAEQFKHVTGLTPACIRALRRAEESPVRKQVFDEWKKQGIRIESYESPGFPQSLRRISDPPPVVFLKGKLLPEDERCIAVIGSRRASPYGLSACRVLVSEMVGEGFAVVSGMARGIDATAHWTALEEGGRTLGVLGTGVDVVYPRSNAPLFRKVPEQGALLSEFLPGTAARPEHFPRRNRLIAGLAWGVLVVEAAERSGTMITVRLALEQGREVFAVPGDVRSPMSRGTNRLIQQGAKLVAGIDDILEEFKYMVRSRKERGCPEAADSTSAEKISGNLVDVPAETLIQWLDDMGIGIDRLVQRSGWPMEKINALLTELELCGRIKRLPGNRYVRVDPFSAT